MVKRCAVELVNRKRSMLRFDTPHTIVLPEALLGMVAPGAQYHGVTLLRSKNWRRPNKSHCRQSCGFLAQKYVNSKTKKRSSPLNWLAFSSNEYEERSLPQLSGDKVSLHNMVSPQNGDTRVGPPPLATPLYIAA